jgi:hypothetical protein
LDAISNTQMPESSGAARIESDHSGVQLQPPHCRELAESTERVLDDEQFEVIGDFLRAPLDNRALSSRGGRCAHELGRIETLTAQGDE